MQDIFSEIIMMVSFTIFLLLDLTCLNSVLSIENICFVNQKTSCYFSVFKQGHNIMLIIEFILKKNSFLANSLNSTDLKQNNIN